MRYAEENWTWGSWDDALLLYLPPNTLIVINLGRCHAVLHLFAKGAGSKLSETGKPQKPRNSARKLVSWRERYVERCWSDGLIWRPSVHAFELLVPFFRKKQSDVLLWIFTMKRFVWFLLLCAILSESDGSDGAQQDRSQHDARHSIVFVTKRPGGYDVLLEVTSHFKKKPHSFFPST
jgi:hypothetical protein